MIKEKMGALEKNLEREVAAKTAKAHLGGTNVARVSSEIKAESAVDVDDEEEVDEDEDGLEPTPLAALDQVYEDNVDDEQESKKHRKIRRLVIKPRKESLHPANPH